MDFAWIPLLAAMVAGFAFGIEANIMHPEGPTVLAQTLFYAIICALFAFMLLGTWYNPRMESRAKRRMFAEKPELAEALWPSNNS